MFLPLTPIHPRKWWQLAADWVLCRNGSCLLLRSRRPPSLTLKMPWLGPGSAKRNSKQAKMDALSLIKLCPLTPNLSSCAPCVDSIGIVRKNIAKCLQNICLPHNTSHRILHGRLRLATRTSSLAIWFLPSTLINMPPNSHRTNRHIGGFWLLSPPETIFISTVPGCASHPKT